MTEFLAGVGAEVVGATALGGMLVAIIGLVLRSLVNGDLITRSQHEREMTAADKKYADMVELKNATIERLLGEKNDWRDTAHTSDARGDVLAEQVKELVSEHRTFSHFMESMRDVVTRGGQSGE